MSSPSSFCSIRSRENRELIFATVARVDSWLLLEYPGAWMRNAVEQSALSDSVLRQLARIRQDNPRNRQLLMRQHYDCRGPFQCFVVRCCDSEPRIRRVVLDSHDDLARYGLEDLEAHGSAEAVTSPMYAVCTHGRHDKCCAKFGLPVYRALREIIGERAWQCSHVGGDRFAANVVVFPHGLYYGQVSVDELPELVAATERGEVFLRRYRGRCCFSRAVQAGEYFVRLRSGRLRLNEFELAEPVRRTGNLSVARFRSVSDGALHDVEFAIDSARLTEFLTCTATTQEPIPQYELLRYEQVRP